jgi:threonine/homoserine/homoserine lactone efflux protein
MQGVGRKHLTQRRRNGGGNLLTDTLGGFLEGDVSGALQKRECQHDGLGFLDGEHERRQIEAGSQPITDAAPTLDGDPHSLKRGNVSIDGSLGLISHVSPTVFTALLYAGAAYMVWIGITLLRSSITIDGTVGVSTPSLWLAFRQGAVTCLLNPKAYLFVLAVYPQFLLPGYGPIWPQALAIGVMTVLMQFMIYGGLAVAAGPSREFLTSRPGMTRLIGRAAGGLFIAIAIMTTLR